jgi:hypothetical protein
MSQAVTTQAGARLALACPRKHETLPRSAGLGKWVGKAHTYITAVVRLPADRAPGLLKTLRKHGPNHVLLDGPSPSATGRTSPVAPAPRRERPGRHRSGKSIARLSPALPGRSHGLTGTSQPPHPPCCLSVVELDAVAHAVSHAHAGMRRGGVGRGPDGRV